MSRSRKKIPYYGNCSDSDKIGKRYANRRLRHTNRAEVKKEKEVFSLIREISDIWDMPKDGKRLIGKLQTGSRKAPKWIRKDAK